MLDIIMLPNHDILLMKRFELALHTLLVKEALCKAETQEQKTSSSEVGEVLSDDSKGNGNTVTNNSPEELEFELGHLYLKDEGQYTAHNILVELADLVVDSHFEVPDGEQEIQEEPYVQSSMESGYSFCMQRPSSCNPLSYTSGMGSSSSYHEMPIGVRASNLGGNSLAMEGPSEEDSCYQLNNHNWLPGDERHCMPMSSTCNIFMPNEWGKCNMPPLSWGGRTVGQREVKNCLKEHNGISKEDYDAFVNIFEGGSILYCNMSFEALLNVRKLLEELAFPCKAVNDGLWLQV